MISLAQPRLMGWLETDDEAIQVWIEGGGPPIHVPHGGTLARSDSYELVERMQKGQELRVVGSPNEYLGAISLAGSAAMMRYIDEVQGRAGRSDALVAKGNRPPPPVTTMTAHPVIRQSPPSTKKPFPAPEALSLAARQKLFCREPDPELLSTHRLDDRYSLVLLRRPCDSGAYNIATTALIAEDGGTSLKEALFDAKGIISEEGSPAFSLAWNEESRRLGESSRGRGIGDCGTRREFAWDGSRFRLVEQAEMPECGGVHEFITTWRADVL